MCLKGPPFLHRAVLRQVFKCLTTSLHVSTIIERITLRTPTFSPLNDLGFCNYCLWDNSKKKKHRVNANLANEVPIAHPSVKWSNDRQMRPNAKLTFYWKCVQWLRFAWTTVCRFRGLSVDRRWPLETFGFFNPKMNQQHDAHKLQTTLCIFLDETVFRWRNLASRTSKTLPTLRWHVQTCRNKWDSSVNQTSRKLDSPWPCWEPSCTAGPGELCHLAEPHASLVQCI